MIYSNVGKVKITQPAPQLCNALNISASDINRIAEAIIGADLISILGALAHEYGEEKALNMWTKSAEKFIEIKKGE